MMIRDLSNSTMSALPQAVIRVLLHRIYMGGDLYTPLLGEVPTGPHNFHELEGKYL